MALKEIITLPEKNEYLPFYQTYFDAIGNQNPAEMIAEQSSVITDLLSGLDDSKANASYAPGKWSVKELLGHIIDTERIFAYRALSVARGETKSLPGFNQDEYVKKGKFNQRTLKSLIDEFITLRKANEVLFESFSRDDLEKTGIANDGVISVRALICIIAGHTMHHVSVLKDKYGL